MSILSVETSGSPEGDATVAALNEFAEANGMTINFVGTGTFEDDIGTQVSAPGRLPTSPRSRSQGSSARSRGRATSCRFPTTFVASVSENWPAGWMSFGNVDGTQYGVPMKSDLKSLVWYMPASFRGGRLRGP